MIILIVLLIIFLASFIFSLVFCYQQNLKEPYEESLKLPALIFVSLTLALAPTFVIGLIFLIVLGSTTTTNIIFSLNLQTDQLLFIAIFFFIYLCTIDTVIDMVLEMLIGKSFVPYLQMPIRMFFFYGIGVLNGLPVHINFWLSFGVSFLVSFIEFLYDGRIREKIRRNK